MQGNQVLEPNKILVICLKLHFSPAPDLKRKFCNKILNRSRMRLTTVKYLLSKTHYEDAFYTKEQGKPPPPVRRVFQSPASIILLSRSTTLIQIEGL